MFYMYRLKWQKSGQKNVASSHDWDQNFFKNFKYLLKKEEKFLSMICNIKEDFSTNLGSFHPGAK